MARKRQLVRFALGFVSFAVTLLATASIMEGRKPTASHPQATVTPLAATAKATSTCDQVAHKEGPLKAPAALVAARCAVQQGDMAAAAELFVVVLDEPLLARRAGVLSEALRVLAQTKSDRLGPALARLDDSANRDIVDTGERERMAAALLETAKSVSGLAQHSAWRQGAHRTLLVKYGETQATARLLNDNGQKLLDALREDDLRLRARSLEHRHAHRLLYETLARISLKNSSFDDRSCEVRYLRGKTARKLRRYKTARKALDEVIRRCPEPWRKKASYTASRVASYQGAKDAARLLEDFIAHYPSDRLTDDVVMWLAELHQGRGQLKQADKHLRKIIEEFADGDQSARARFLLAWRAAEAKRWQQAAEQFGQIALSTTNIVEKDRARYWQARILAFPDLDSLKANADTQASLRGQRLLNQLSTERPASYHGHMARLLTDRQLPIMSTSRKLPRVGEPPAVLLLRRWLAAGYDDVVREVIEVLPRDGDLVAKHADEIKLLAWAHLAVDVGRPDLAHQLLRWRGYARAKGDPDKAPRLWRLAFPHAFADEIDAGARQNQIPAPLLRGLAREESAFDERVVSWAGAIGLCQLMPPTAKEEAGLVGVDDKNLLESIREGALNARLGGHHLKRRWDLLKHPLLAIAAYNAGPGNVKKWRRQKGEPVDSFVERIPVAQTRNYVKKVTGSWVTYSLLDDTPDAERARLGFSSLLP